MSYDIDVMGLKQPLAVLYYLFGDNLSKLYLNRIQLSLLFNFAICSFLLGSKREFWFMKLCFSLCLCVCVYAMVNKTGIGQEGMFFFKFLNCDLW